MDQFLVRPVFATRLKPTRPLSRCCVEEAGVVRTAKQHDRRALRALRRDRLRGMATVHLARQVGDAGFARIVAIKRLHERYARDPEFVAMFLDEARIVARIRHPNVVQTIDVVAEDGELFLVMEYIHGESLLRMMQMAIRSAALLPVPVAAAILVGALHGLQEAHDARGETGEPLGIVHRDVSPHNVLIGTDGAARVLDFGVAKASQRIQTTLEGQLKGKLSYMAPEQITNRPTDRRTDVYSAAVVLWEALTGTKLFQGDSEGAVLNQILLRRRGRRVS
jgi:serine/threonine protein kinase